MITFFVVVGIILFVVAIYLASDEHSKQKQQTHDESVYISKKIDTFDYDKKFLSDDGTKAILFSDNNKELHFFDKIEYNKINYKDILQIEIIEDKESVTQTARKSQIASTLLGGIIAGGTGAIIGGLSSKKKHTEVVNELGLRIIVNDTSSPIHEFIFYNFSYPVKKRSSQFKLSYKNVYEWFKLFEVLIHQADNKEMTQQQ